MSNSLGASAGWHAGTPDVIFDGRTRSGPFHWVLLANDEMIPGMDIRPPANGHWSGGHLFAPLLRKHSCLFLAASFLPLVVDIHRLLPTLSFTQKASMLPLILLLPAVLVIESSAAPLSDAVSTSISADITCITRYRHHGPPLETIPTSTRTSCTMTSITATDVSSTIMTLTPTAVYANITVRGTAGAQPGTTLVDSTALGGCAVELTV